MSRNSVLRLYRQSLRESNKFDAYIYRKYAFRRIRDAFTQNQSISDPKIIESLFKEGEQHLELIRRQVVISNLFKSEKLVIETN